MKYVYTKQTTVCTFAFNGHLFNLVDMCCAQRNPLLPCISRNLQRKNLQEDVEIVLIVTKQRIVGDVIFARFGLLKIYVTFS